MTSDQLATGTTGRTQDAFHLDYVFVLRNEDYMNRNDQKDDGIREQSSAPGAVRGKYYEQYMAGSNIVRLAPDVAEAFHDSESVNAALRQYLAEHGKAPGRSAE